MTDRETFLDQEPTELTQFLLEQARRERPPAGARQRALSTVAAASATGHLLVSSTAHGSARITTALFAKWVALGAVAGTLTAGTWEGLKSDPVAEAPRATQARETAPSRPEGRAREGSPAQPNEEVQRPAEKHAEANPRVGIAVPADAHPSHPTELPDANTPTQTEPLAQTQPARTQPAQTQPASGLPRELQLLEQARTALSTGSGGVANRTLDDYAREFPTGALHVEATALRIEALGQLGKYDAARELAETFLARHSSSPLAVRVRALVANFRTKP